MGWLPSSNIQVDNTTIDQNPSGQLRIKPTYESKIIKCQQMDTVAVTFPSSEGTLKTYAGLVFTITKGFRITLIYGTTANETIQARLRLSDGTNNSDFAIAHTIDNNASGNQVKLVLDVFPTATATQAILRGLLSATNTTIQTYQAGFNQAPITLAASGTWASLTTIIVRGVASTGTAVLREVILEEISV